MLRADRVVHVTVAIVRMRRLDHDYQRLPQTSEAMIKWAMIGTHGPTTRQSSLDGLMTNSVALHRLSSVDVVRGLVMILMALDHARDFSTVPSLIDPTNLAQTTTADFLTRWITHICAPTFFLLMGTGAFFSGRRRTRAVLSRFLLTRGRWVGC